MMPSAVIAAGAPAVGHLLCAIFPNASTYYIPIGMILYCGNLLGYFYEMNPTKQATDKDEESLSSATNPTTPHGSSVTN